MTEWKEKENKAWDKTQLTRSCKLWQSLDKNVLINTYIRRIIFSYICKLSNIFQCVCVFMRVRALVCLSACVCLHVFVCMCLSACVCLHVFVLHVFVCMCLSACVCLHVFVCMCLSACVCLHVFVCICLCMRAWYVRGASQKSRIYFYDFFAITTWQGF